MKCEIDKNKTLGCDRISQTYCDTFNALRPLYVTDDNVAVLGNIQINLNSMDCFDRAALGLYIGKFVEQEINSSVVQLMRYAIGIDMPEFYCKRDPAFSSFCGDGVDTRRKNIRLNKQAIQGKIDSLATIPAGDAYYALEALREEYSVFDEYAWLSESAFLDAWRKLFAFRNIVAHIGHLISQEELDEAFGWFEVFLKYMPKIVALKKKLAPEGFFDEIKQAPKVQSDADETTHPTHEQYVRYKYLIGKDYECLTEDEVQELNHYSIDLNWMTIIFAGADGKKGLKHADGHVLVPAIYDGFEFTYDCVFYNLPVIPAKKNGKWGLVKCDGSGDVVTEFIYDRIEDVRWNKHIFTYYKGGSLSYGLLLNDGRELCPCIIDMCYEPTSTCLIFKCGDYYGLYDLGDRVVMPMFDAIEVNDPFEPMVFTLNGILGYLDEELRFVPKSEIDSMEDEEDRHDRMLGFLPAELA